MGFLLFLIFIIALGGGVYFFAYKQDQAMTNLQRNNRLLRNQLNTIKEKNELLFKSSENYSIEFLNLNDNFAILNKNTFVYISPNENSYVMQKVMIDMQVSLIQKAMNDNTIWYYISLPIESKINSSGWVKELSLKDFSITKIEASIN